MARCELSVFDYFLLFAGLSESTFYFLRYFLIIVMFLRCRHRTSSIGTMSYGIPDSYASKYCIKNLSLLSMVGAKSNMLRKM